MDMSNNNIPPQPSTPPQANNSMQAGTGSGRSAAPLLGIVVLLAGLIAVYFWYQYAKNTSDSQMGGEAEQSLGSIEAELNATELQNLDQEMDEMEKEILQ